MMKRNTVIAAICLLASLVCSACAPAAPGAPTSTENTGTPAFLNALGTPLSEFDGEVMVRSDGFPDRTAVCFGEAGAEYVPYFFGTQSGDAEKAMKECENQLKCAGFITTAGVLFPDMEEDMSFGAFFSLIGVDEHEYLLGEDVITGAGWLRFQYHGMEVMVNTNEIRSDGGWEFTGAETVKRSAPVSIVDQEISNTNESLAEAVMFG